MSLLQNIFGLRGPLTQPELKVEIEPCPNCWGEQEYDGMIRQKLRDVQIDVNSRRASYGFLRKFVVTHLEGIRLRKSIISSVIATRENARR